MSTKQVSGRSQSGESTDISDYVEGKENSEENEGLKKEFVVS